MALALEDLERRREAQRVYMRICQRRQKRLQLVRTVRRRKRKGVSADAIAHFDGIMGLNEPTWKRAWTGARGMSPIALQKSDAFVSNALTPW